MAEDVFITAAARTAMGGFQGALSPLSAPEIGGPGFLSHARLLDRVRRDIIREE